MVVQSGVHGAGLLAGGREGRENPSRAEIEEPFLSL